MAAGRRRGTTNAFWDAATVDKTGATSKSAYVQMGRNVDQIVIYVNTTGVTGGVTFAVQVAHSGNPTSDGTIDVDAISTALGTDTPWHDLWYLNGTPAQALFTFTASGGKQALQIPDIVPNWFRLIRTDTNTGTVTVTAGWEAVGE